MWFMWECCVMVSDSALLEVAMEWRGSRWSVDQEDNDHTPVQVKRWILLERFFLSS
jgi:hypothetical protein